MKIAEICVVFPPYQGGLGTACEQNARMLAEAGHEVTVFTPHYRRIKKLEEKKDLPYTVKYLRPWLEYGNAAWTPQLLMHLKGFDVIHLHYPALGMVQAALLSKMLRKDQKLYVTYHMDLVGTKKSVKSVIFNYYNTHVAPKVVKCADRIFVSSKDYAAHSHIGGYFEKTPEKFVEIPFGVDTSFFYPRSVDAVRAELKIREDEKIILFVGGLGQSHYFKGVEYLLEAFELIIHKERFQKKHKNYRLLIVGQGDLKEHYEAFAAQLELKDRVRFLGGVPTADLPLLYSLADVSVLPSIDSSEAFGIVLIEATACGTPVIASNLPGVRSVVDPGVTGLLVKPRDIQGLASAIFHITNDAQLREKMGKAALARVHDRYSYEVVSKRLNSSI